ncbi:MAG TPA: hypothetical protein VMD98_14330 [Bryocella sp.]|nr:hypothetical protein [Bryocella sp.]
MLIAIKILHTAIWAVLAALILALPVLGILHWFRRAAIVSAIVLVECAVLAANRWTCPLTAWAGRFTTDRAANFDIYLPLRLAQHNKRIFGLLFVIGEVVVLACWLLQKHRPEPTAVR